MLTKSDELLCHQIATTLDHVDTSDRSWTEKIMLDGYDRSGDMVFAFGIGKYANRNVMDGFGSVSVGGKQHTVRASRELYPDIDTVRVGPVSYEVVEPLKTVRACLAENDFGISFDVELAGRMPAHEEPVVFNRYKGALVSNTIRYYQLCRVRGRLVVEGKAHDIHEDTWYAFRDHSWGIRNIMGVYRAPGGWRHPADTGRPESGLEPRPRERATGHMGLTICIEFKDFGVFTTYVEDPEGRQVVSVAAPAYIVYPFGIAKHPERLVAQQFNLEFEPGTRQLRSGEAVLSLPDGTEKHISIRPLGFGVYTFACGYFGGFKDWWHGKWMGPSWIDGEALDLTDSRLVEQLQAGGLRDVTVECRCDGEIGYGVIQHGLWGDLPKYGLKAYKETVDRC